MKIIGDDSTSMIYNPIISGTSVYTLISSSSTLRVAKLNAATGVITIE